jgi:hypothetical protein
MPRYLKSDKTPVDDVIIPKRWFKILIDLPTMEESYLLPVRVVAYIELLEEQLTKYGLSPKLPIQEEEIESN